MRIISKIIRKSARVAQIEIVFIFQLFNDQFSHHIETNQSICSVNQLTGFYMMGTLVVKRLI